uniref:Uncharacterized protein n=1 Tax=Anguilla anguilla TaxID=7936 RepID=A0A0E9TG04_ANGAN
MWFSSPHFDIPRIYVLVGASPMRALNN